MSSASVYGFNENILDEGSKTNPLTQYAKSKVDNEKYILDNDFNFETVILRNSTVFGFSNNLRLDLVVNDLTYNAVVNNEIELISDGSPKRPFIHVQDLCNLINLIINTDQNLDKEIINTSLKSLKDFRYSSGTLTVGNVEIFNLLISKLDIPKRWKLRLSRHFWREDYFNDLLQRLETNSDVDPTIVEVDKKRYLKMLKDDQSSIVASRSIKEILERFDKKIKDPRKPSRGRNISKIIKEFLRIKCPINKAANELNKFFKKYKINLVVDQKYFPISKNKVSKLNVIFSTAFGRQLEYYTGMVFKIDIKSKSKIINCCNGGRYDKLISDLGSNKQIPAVGAALNLNY